METNSRSLADLVILVKSFATWRVFAGGVILFGIVCLSPFPAIFPQIMERYPLICFHMWIALVFCILGLAESLLDKFFK